MSRTKNNAGDVKKFWDQWDSYYTEDRSGVHAVPSIHQKLTRHPNKKKSHSLNQEWKGNSSQMGAWRNRFDEENMKSSRMHAYKSAGVGTRRSVMKEQTKQLIEDSYEDIDLA